MIGVVEPNALAVLIRSAFGVILSLAYLSDWLVTPNALLRVLLSLGPAFDLAVLTPQLEPTSFR